VNPHESDLSGSHHGGSVRVVKPYFMNQIYCGVDNVYPNCTSAKLRTILWRYQCVTLTWTMVAIWLALQVPLGMLVGKSIKLGMEEPMAARKPLRPRRRARASRDWLRASAPLSRKAQAREAR